MTYLGLRDRQQVKKRKEKAIKAGRDPCKSVGGILMFDIDELIGTFKESKINRYSYSKEELEIFSQGRLF